MLHLTTPLVIHPDTYEALFPVRGEFDLRTQTVRLELAPVQVDATHVRIGVRDNTKAETHFLFPAPVRRVTLSNNPEDPDPVIDEILSRLLTFLEGIEELLVTTQTLPGGIAAEPYQLGTQEWSLAVTFSPIGARALGQKEIGPRKPPKGAPSAPAPSPEALAVLEKMRGGK